MLSVNGRAAGYNKISKNPSKDFSIIIVSDQKTTQHSLNTIKFEGPRTDLLYRKS